MTIDTQKILMKKESYCGQTQETYVFLASLWNALANRFILELLTQKRQKVTPNHNLPSQQNVSNTPNPTVNAYVIEISHPTTSRKPVTDPPADLQLLRQPLYW